MSIVASELVWRRSATVNDTTSNGGIMTSTAITSGVKNNIFPDVPQSERTAGSTKYRKVFIHVANDADLTLVAPKVYVETRTPGDDRVLFFAADQTDTASGISGSERKYGSGALNSTVNSGVQSIDVAVEAAADAIFQNGDTIRISDKATINGAGNEEFVTIDQAVSWNGNIATIHFTPALVNGYSSTNTKVASVYAPGDVACSFDNWVENAAGSGTYAEATEGNVVLDNIGTIEQTWTLTFTDATNFTIVGNTVGSVGTGSKTLCSPSNPAYSKPYFTINAAGWSGTWASGDTIVFQTHPASIPLWYVRIVPAGASSLSGNSVVVAVDGESA